MALQLDFDNQEKAICVLDDVLTQVENGEIELVSITVKDARGSRTWWMKVREWAYETKK